MSKTTSHLVRATHKGSVSLGVAPIDCYVLETGTRVLVAGQIQGLLGASKNRNLSRLIDRISSGNEGLSALPVAFTSPGGLAYGYDSEDVVKILRAYQRAFLRGTLHAKQIPMAMAAMAAIEAFASVGLQALIDEATGYQSKRDPDALQKHYARIFRENLAPWEEQFDEMWDRTMCRLYGYPYEGRPPLFIRSINAMVYRFAFGVDAYRELKKRNPAPRHRRNHHQHLTPDAKIKLSQTLNTVKGIARLSRNPKDFVAKLGVVYEDVPEAAQQVLDVGW